MKRILLLVTCLCSALLSQAGCTGNHTFTTSTTYETADQTTVDGLFEDHNYFKIPTGVTVRINSCTLKVRLPNTYFDIEIGGRLILDNSVVVVGAPMGQPGAPGNPCTQAPYFSGFTVTGTSGAAQYTSRHSPFDPSNKTEFTDVTRYSASHGVLIMTGSEVKATGPTSSNAYTITSTNGGCVELYDCHFLNNRNGIKISNFLHTTNDIADYNAFNIINCTFEAAANGVLSAIGDEFIYLSSVRRVQIEGCKFINDMSYTNNSGNLRKIKYGIRYQSSTFFLQRSGFARQAYYIDEETDCPKYAGSYGQRNTFRGLPYGILNGAAAGFNDGEFIIADCDFTDCLAGMAVAKGKGGTIARNTYTFNDGHSYTQLLGDAEGLGTSTDQIYFMRIVESEKIAITENKGHITAATYTLGAGTYDIRAAFVTIEKLKSVGGIGDQINIYRNADRNFTNYLGENVSGGFICGGSRNSTHVTYGVQLVSVLSGFGAKEKTWLGITCNDFTGLSHPIKFRYTASVGMNNDQYMESNGQKAAMNVFTDCVDPAVGSNGQTVVYRYLDSGTGHDPGNVTGNVTKKSTTTSADCGGLKCEKKAWGSGLEEPMVLKNGEVAVYPNPNRGSFHLSWLPEAEYKA